MTKAWVALDKQLATTFSKIRREYSEIEAMFSLSLDVNCGKQRSHRAYSRMWTWSVTRVIRFVKKVKEGETLTKQQRNTNETPYSLITLGIEDATKQQRNSNETLAKHKYKEQEQEEEKSIVEQPPRQQIPHAEIVAFLNKHAETNFKSTTKATQGFIKARWREGFRLSDFQSVILNKCEEWLGDEKMGEYLRPQTLFGTKFESYLQASSENIKPQRKWISNANQTTTLPN